MDRKIENSSYGGKGQEDYESISSPKDCQQNDLSAILPHSEISQVEDVFSNSTSLAFTDEGSQTDDEDHNVCPSELENDGYTATGQPDEESENTGEIMTIYEDNAFTGVGNGNVTSMADQNPTQAVPECSRSTPTRNNSQNEVTECLGYVTQMQGTLDNWIARIGEYWHSRCDATERQLQANLLGTSSLELQEKFGIAETQIELINQILEETKKRGDGN